MNQRRLTLASLLAGLALAFPAHSADKDTQGIEFFEGKIRPVLVNHCYECHSSKASKVKGGLLLDTRDGLRSGGDTGPAVVPGDPGKSLLIQALRHDGLKMPPKKQLPDAVVADFTRWVQMGAPDPRDGTAAGYKRMSAEEAKTFWSFQLPKKVEPPRVKGEGATEIDRFILARLEEKKLEPTAPADARVLIRRLSFDLVGLPPTPEEVDAFVKESQANPQTALEKLVDRLLASKQFGERWGRHWLDLARYAESNGNADNTPFPHAWRYRDWVIKALNDDKPYNRFVTEQVAGDLLKEDDAKKKDDLLIATGFLALTSKPRAQNNPDYRMDLVADQVDVTTRAVLGLTVMCSRCHDHKFDYISTKEYYALAGIFDSTQMLAGAGGRGGGRQAGPGGLHKLSDGGEAMGVADGKPGDCQVCIRGETQKKGERVPRGFLQVATVGKAPAIPSGTSGRSELAAWLTSNDNPLTARVAVNRVWLHLFGRGLVDSPDNFGYLGERPTHPELLDWLAVQFVQDGWSMKKIIRRIVLSRTYRMASDYHAGNYRIDPDNRLLWRATTRRLEGEVIRDAMLASSGQLRFEPPSGSSTEGTTNAKGRRPNYTSKDGGHRSIYLGLPRGAALPEVLSLFDVANPNLVVAQREITTVPAQALFLMNSPFVHEQAKALAKRVQASPNLDEAGRVDLAYRLTLARPATSGERDRAIKFIKDAGGRDDAWAGFCQTLYASAEFRYVD